MALVDYSKRYDPDRYDEEQREAWTAFFKNFGCTTEKTADITKDTILAAMESLKRKSNRMARVYYPPGLEEPGVN